MMNDQTTICPRCAGTGMVGERPPVRLSPTMLRIWDIVSHGDGVSSAELANRIYTAREKPRPEHAIKIVHVTICNANKLLAAEGWRIQGTGGSGSVYHLVRTGDAK